MMHTSVRALSIVAVALLLSGCAFNRQTANLSPTVTVMDSQEGHDVKVFVTVTDERPSKSLGRRGTGYGAAAEITAAQDVAVTVKEKVTTGLKKRGFEVVEDVGAANASFAIEVRLLEYSTSSGFWTGGVHVKGALKGLVTKNGKTYEKMYRSEKEERVMVVPTAETNEKWINNALSAVLQEMADDSGLLMFLTK